MKTWKLTTRKPDAETILVEADSLLVAKTGNLVFAQKDGIEDAWPVNPDDTFYQLDNFTIVRVQAAGTYTECVLEPRGGRGDDRGGDNLPVLQ